MPDDLWRDRALCNEANGANWLPMDAWWPSGRRMSDVNWQAVDECQLCPVISACEALVSTDEPVHGIWAGVVTINEIYGPKRVTKLCQSCRTRYGNFGFRPGSAGVCYRCEPVERVVA